MITLDHLLDLQNQSDISEADRCLIKSCADNEDPEVRLAAAICLGFFFGPEEEKILIERIQVEKDPLVLVNICDSLSNSSRLETMKYFKQGILNKDYLVRGYCVLGIADIALNAQALNMYDSLKQFLEKNLASEKNHWVRVAYFRSLVLLGNNQYVEDILQYIHAKDYHIRLLAVECLYEIKNTLTKQEQMRKILTALQQRLCVEEVLCVRDALQNYCSDEQL